MTMSDEDALRAARDSVERSKRRAASRSEQPNTLRAHLAKADNEPFGRNSVEDHEERKQPSQDFGERETLEAATKIASVASALMEDLEVERSDGIASGADSQWRELITGAPELFEKALFAVHLVSKVPLKLTTLAIRILEHGYDESKDTVFDGMLNSIHLSARCGFVEVSSVDGVAAIVATARGHEAALLRKALHVMGDGDTLENTLKSEFARRDDVCRNQAALGWAVTVILCVIILVWLLS